MLKDSNSARRQESDKPIANMFFLSSLSWCSVEEQASEKSEVAMAPVPPNNPSNLNNPNNPNNRVIRTLGKNPGHLEKLSQITANSNNCSRRAQGQQQRQ